jgi:Holliday junction resolvasome RuvABC ATP-dependent DNA helicase subunit
MDYFEGVIGQSAVKRKLKFRLDTHRKNGAILPHSLFVGSKGDGKSFMVRKFARNFPDPTDPSKNNKDFYALNAGAIKNPTMLFEDIFAKTQGDYCTFFIDEAHDIPKKVETVLLSILEPNQQRRTVYNWEGADYVFDFRMQTFLFATTEEDQVFHALRDRLDTISLAPYSISELSEIISLNLQDSVILDDGLLLEMGKYIRRNARSAERLAHDIMSTGLDVFKNDDWEELKRVLSILPLGLSRDELRALQILRDDGDLSLGMLSSRLGRPTTAVMRDLEVYPKALGFIEVDGKRHLTPKGHEYLRNMEGKK